MRFNPSTLNSRTGRFSSLKVGNRPVSWVELAEGTVSAAASLDIFFNPTEWRAIKVICTDFIPNGDGDALSIRTSTDGSTFDSAGTDYAWAATKSTTGGAVALDANASSGQIQADVDQGNAANEVLNAEITILDPSTSTYKSIHYSVDSMGSTPDFRSIVGMGKRLSAADVDGIQIFFATVNIASGRYKVLGLRE